MHSASSGKAGARAFVLFFAVLCTSLPGTSAFGFALGMLGRSLGKGLVLNAFRRNTQTSAAAAGARAQATLTFDSSKAPQGGFGSSVLVGKKALLLRNSPQGPASGVDKSVYGAMVDSISDEGSASTWLRSGGKDDKPLKLTVASLPANTTRNNHVLSPHALQAAVEAHCKGQKSNTKLTILLEDAAHAPVAACSVAKALPLYSAKTGNAAPKPTEVSCSFLVDGAGGELEDAAALRAAEAASAGVRLAASLVDRPPHDLTPAALADAAKAVAAELDGVSVTEHVVGEALRDKGYGGIWGVGPAPPAPGSSVPPPAHAAGLGNDAQAGRVQARPGRSRRRCWC